MVDDFRSAVDAARASVSDLTLDGVRETHEQLLNLRDELDELLLVLQGMEQIKLAEDYGKAAEDGFLQIWELDDLADPTGRQREIAKVMGRRPDAAWSPRDVHAGLEVRGVRMRLEAVQTLLRRMAGRGYLDRRGRGQYVLAHVRRQTMPGNA